MGTSGGRSADRLRAARHPRASANHPPKHDRASLPDGESVGVTTSDLSIDETILLHSIGWQPVDLVCGAGCYSIPEGFWSLGQGESTPATLAWERSVRHAVEDAH